MEFDGKLFHRVLPVQGHRISTVDYNDQAVLSASMETRRQALALGSPLTPGWEGPITGLLFPPEIHDSSRTCCANTARACRRHGLPGGHVDTGIP